LQSRVLDEVVHTTRDSRQVVVASRGSVAGDSLKRALWAQANVMPRAGESFTLLFVPRRGTEAERVLRTARAEDSLTGCVGSLTGRISPEPA
jgi:hypothetical protein